MSSRKDPESCTSELSPTPKSHSTMWTTTPMWRIMVLPGASRTLSVLGVSEQEIVAGRSAQAKL
ncbi:MAG TPA: hypothetical protein VIK88_00875 [Candidatus Bathyarchaeia archaeon]